MPLLRKVIFLFLAFIATTANAQWVRSAKSQAFSRSTAIGNDDAGNVFAVGIFTCVNTIGGVDLLNNTCGEVTLPPLAAPQIDGFLTRYDENGVLVWVNQYEGKPSNKFFINDIAVDAAGNSYIVGAFTDSIDLKMPTWYYNQDATTDIFVARVLPDGTTDWVTTFDADSISEGYAQRVALTDDALYITGYLRGRFDMAAVADSVGNDQGFVAAFDLAGNPLWMNNFFEGDATSSSTGKALTASGDSIWVFYEFSDRVVIQPNDTIAPPGALVNAGVLAHYDAAGALLDYKIATTPYVEDMQVFVPDSSIYITGRAENITAIGPDTLFDAAGIRAFVSSLDLSSSVRWTMPVTSPVTAELTGTAIAVNADSTVLASGVFGGATVSAPNTAANGTGDTDGYVVMLDAAGVDAWIQSLGGAREDRALGVSSPDDEHIYAAGYFDQYIRVGGDEIFNYTDSGKNNAFWARIDICPQFIAEMITADTVYICDRDSALFQVSDDLTYTYAWFKDDVPVADADTSAIYFKEAGLYNAEIAGPGCTKRTPYARLLINPLPDSVVTPGAMLDFCEGDTITLAGPLAAYTFQWFRDGMLLPADTLRNIEVSTQGDYHLQITDSLTCTVLSDTFEVRVYAYPLSTLTPPGRHVICSGDSVVIQADDSQADMTYRWKNGDLELPDDTLSAYQAKTEGIYSVVIQNAIGCETETEADTVVVQQSPVVDLNDETAPDAICQGGSATLVTPSVIGQMYQWIRNGADMPGETGNSLEVTVAGDYQVRVNNALCETTTDPFTITVNPLPVPVIVNPEDTAVCEDSNYELSASEAPDQLYQWYRNGLVLSVETAPVLVVSATGNYTVEVTNAFNCRDTSPATSVTVNIPPPAGITPQGLTTFCSDESVILRANAGSGLAYRWFADNALIPGETNRDLVVSSGGLYTVEVTNTNKCTGVSEAEEINVIAYPDATIQSINGLNSICDRDSLELLGGIDPGYEFTWLYGQQVVSTAGNTFYARLPGDYKVVATVGGCRDTSSVLTLDLRPNPLPVITRNADFLSIALFGDIQWYVDGAPVPNTSLQVIQAQANGYYRVSVTNNVGCTAWSDSLPVCLPVAEIDKHDDVLTVTTNGQAYIWHYGGIPINGAVLRVLTAQQSGTYSAVVTDGNGCTMETTPVVVCIPYPEIGQDPVTGVLYASPNPAMAYQWYIESDNTIYESIFDAATQVHIPDGPGAYKVEVTDLEGCTSFSEPFAIYPVTGDGGSPFNTIRLYPNPVPKILVIERPAHEKDMPVALYTADGKQLLRKNFSGPVMYIDLEAVDAGAYWLTLGEGAFVHTYKVVKK